MENFTKAQKNGIPGIPETNTNTHAINPDNPKKVLVPVICKEVSIYTRLSVKETQKCYDTMEDSSDDTSVIDQSTVPYAQEIFVPMEYSEDNI